MLNLPPVPFAAIGPDWLQTWVTPIWILGVGALVGLVILLFLWGVLLAVSRPAALEIPYIFGEGILVPITVVLLAYSAIGLAGTLVVRDPAGMLKSVPRFLATGSINREMQVPTSAAGEPSEFAIAFRGDELSYARITSDQPLLINSQKSVDPLLSAKMPVEPGEPLEWVRGAESISPLGPDPIRYLYVTNLGGAAANVRMELRTEPVYPQVAAMVVTVVAVLGVYLLYFAQRILLPKTSAIALATAKSEMSSPLFSIVAALGGFLLFIFLFIPYHTFGEDIKMLKDSGFTTIMILCLIQAVWGASSSVADEIEGKTALTVLSKPIGRRQFIVGKFLGISWSSAVIFILLGAWFLILVAYKPVYDARESSKLAPLWQESYVEVVRTVPGLLLAFMETVVLAALSVAISTRLPLLANFSICFAIYVLGHLTALIVQSSVGSLPPVAFMGNFLATILPVLDHFNIQAAVAGGRDVPLTYLLTALLYCILYSSVAMLLALVLFEDRDLA
jgi:ABC-type transport system involved in multi-copper enzyme maturation permease subunit